MQFTVEARGPPDHTWYITEALYDSQTGQRLWGVDGNYLEGYRFIPHAGERAVTFPSWIQDPARAGTYFVEIEVNDRAGTNAEGVSAKFRSPGPAARGRVLLR